MKLEDFTEKLSTDIYKMRIVDIIKEGGYSKFKWADAHVVVHINVYVSIFYLFSDILITGSDECQPGKNGSRSEHLCPFKIKLLKLLDLYFTLIYLCWYKNATVMI